MAAIVALDLSRDHSRPPGVTRSRQPVPADERCSSRTPIVIHGHLGGRIVLPDQVRHTVAIEVVGPYYRPARVAAAVQPVPALIRRSPGPAVIVHRDLPARHVFPYQIRRPVAIEIRRRGYVPARRLAILVEPVPALIYSAARTSVIVHRHLIRRVVFPNQVGHPVVVHIGHRHYRPAWMAGGVQPVPPEEYVPGRSAIVVYRDLSSRHIFPDQVRHAVAIEVRRSHQHPAAGLAGVVHPTEPNICHTFGPVEVMHGYLVSAVVLPKHVLIAVSIVIAEAGFALVGVVRRRLEAAVHFCG